MRHRPPEDEEPFNYWKRGHLNILHARLRMREVVDGLLTWEPGMPAAGRRRRAAGAHRAGLTPSSGGTGGGTSCGMLPDGTTTGVVRTGNLHALPTLQRGRHARHRLA